MNTREYYAQAFKAERPKFVRVLQAVPGEVFLRWNFLDQIAYGVERQVFQRSEAHARLAHDYACLPVGML